MYIMKRLTTQRVGGIADCHTITIRRDVHLEQEKKLSNTGDTADTGTIARTWTARSAYTRFLD